ncbi:GntR family transcriptional regulator [Streptosporangium sp. NBC_01755]|uniref:GntR family transcriptional regulator n=1 Tax=unclassified Streptosporangium TaxID=2632669 RepID=UPI002DDB25D7|nr:MULTISPECIES: GntR family transcriptional regulator [unclassified Streptosporangium]WSA28224.1 GntR family transcriptional regulator [Streptosporangium sp. NBC_01810]WSD00299.1 GntR family transcriptional regulator [Streptosporangium sp. NBC_01755]
MDTGLYTERDTPIRLRRDQVYGELRRRLMLGEFAIRTRLVEERVASLLGVSRTPVREALVRLLADGLVERGSDGGYYVAQPDLSDLRDLYELRITLELRGISRALDANVQGHDAAILEPLRDQWRAMRDDQPEPDPQFVLMDEDFHITMSRASGNAALTGTLESVNARIRAVRMYDFLTADRITLTILQHLEIAEEVLAGRLAEALTAMHRHVGESMDVVERRAAHAITQMALNRGRRHDPDRS